MTHQPKEKTKCLENQAKIKSNGLCTEKVCGCGATFYVNQYARSSLCCECRHNHEIAKKRARVRNKLKALPGYPCNQVFRTREEMEDYLQGNGDRKIQCLECGNWFGRLGIHLQSHHTMTVEEYKQKYGIPFTGYGLASQYVKSFVASLGRERQKQITDDERERAISAMKKGKDAKVSPHKNMTEYYMKELKENAKKALAVNPLELYGHKECEHPCGSCGGYIKTKTKTAVTMGCKLLCDQCKKVSQKKAQQKCVRKMKIERPEDYEKLLSRQRITNKKQRLKKQEEANRIAGDV